MKKSGFVKLVICVVAGLFFSIGLCMCLLPEWNAFTAGVILTAIGGVALIATGIIESVKNRKVGVAINWKTVGKIAYGVIAALVLGVGMCMVMVWDMLILGIIVGIIGIVMILFLIPMFLGFKN